MPDSPRAGHVALAGAPNVGKSSLLNCLVGEHLALVSPKAQATRLPVVGIRSDPATQFVFHDLPGLLEPGYALQAAMRHAAEERLREVDVILHLHPAVRAPAPPFAELIGLRVPALAPVVLAYTRGDELPARERARLGSAAIVTSARTGEGIDALLAAVRAFLPEQPFLYEADDVGTQPMRFFVVEYLREAAFELLGDELPYAFTAEVEEFREDARPVYIRVTLYVERNSQKGMVIGQGGRTIRELGAHARRRLEALLGTAVYLDCWVKVLPAWRTNPDLLGRFGFPRVPTETR